jgi:hypothetical protein
MDLIGQKAAMDILSTDLLDTLHHATGSDSSGDSLPLNVTICPGHMSDKPGEQGY